MSLGFKLNTNLIESDTISLGDPGNNLLESGFGRFGVFLKCCPFHLHLYTVKLLRAFKFFYGYPYISVYIRVATHYNHTIVRLYTTP